MQATLANGITTTTNGTYIAVQPIGGTAPALVEIAGAATGTSGAISVTVQVQSSADASSWSTDATQVLSGTFTNRPFSFLHTLRKPFLRLNVSAISGTGAALRAIATF